MEDWLRVKATVSFNGFICLGISVSLEGFLGITGVQHELRSVLFRRRVLGRSRRFSEFLFKFERTNGRHEGSCVINISTPSAHCCLALNKSVRRRVGSEKKRRVGQGIKEEAEE
ncbi:hypothetical protein BDW66DRAFT_123241 [Aspergillus desertorum]